ncbi:MAG TPA: hypothetical protein DCZ76_08930 [Treponema sp.]|nr:hypothetical protein [Treponema sp.]
MLAGQTLKQVQGDGSASMGDGFESMGDSFESMGDRSQFTVTVLSSWMDSRHSGSDPESVEDRY